MALVFFIVKFTKFCGVFVTYFGTCFNFQVCQFPVFSKFGELCVKLKSNIKSVYLTEEQIMEVKLFHYSLFTSIIPVAKHYLVFSKDSYLIAPVKEGETEMFHQQFGL